MALYLKDGSLLLKDGMLTTSQACCCGGGACCLPERCVLAFIASFPGVSESAPEIAGCTGEVLNTNEGSTVCAYRKVLQAGQEQCVGGSEEVLAENEQIESAVAALGGVSFAYSPTWFAASCEDGLSQSACAEQGGTYHAGKTCAEEPCAQGACCLPDGSCQDGLTQGECESCGSGCPPVDGCRLIVARVYDGFEIEDFNELLANESPCGQCEFCFAVADIGYEEGGDYTGGVTIGYGADCEPVIVSTSVVHSVPEGEGVTWPTLSIRLEGCTGAGERGTYHPGKTCAEEPCCELFCRQNGLTNTFDEPPPPCPDGWFGNQPACYKDFPSQDCSECEQYPYLVFDAEYPDMFLMGASCVDCNGQGAGGNPLP